MISTDQEGGMVSRLVGVTQFPGNMILGATRNVRLAKRDGQAIARQLKAVGINIDFIIDEKLYPAVLCEAM